MAESCPRKFPARHAPACALPPNPDFSGQLPPCPARLDCRGDANPLPLPRPLWRLLHRAVDQFSHPRHAARQAGRRGMRAVGRRAAVQTLRQTRTPGILRLTAAIDGDVRKRSPHGACLPGDARSSDRAIGGSACCCRRGFSPDATTARVPPRRPLPHSGCADPIRPRGTGPSAAHSAVPNTAGSRFPGR
jgi:hypothetical protein